MKIKLNDLLIISFLILVSLIIKEVQFAPIVITLLFIVFGDKIDPGIKNLAYVAIATIPFIPFFIFFLFYLLFIVIGSLLGNVSFVKKYVFAVSATLVLRLIVYNASVIGLSINAYFILILLLIFLAASYYFFIKKSGISSLKSLFSVSSEDFRIMLMTLFCLFAVANVIYNSTSLYQSNGTQIYAKQHFIIDTIDKYGFFPLYDPSTGMGEELFLTDSPAHFTKDILIISTIFLKQWFSPILIYNAYSMFVLWIVILGASILLKELLSTGNQNNSKFTAYLIILGSVAIGLSFQFVRILESFKSFSAHAVNLLLFAMLMSKPKKAVEWFVICYLTLFSYMIHPIQFIGVFIFAVSILIVLYIKDLDLVKSGLNYLLKNKFKIVLVILIFVGIMFSYTAIGYFYKDYVRQHPSGIFNPDPIFNIKDYFTHYFADENTTPFSIKYPDLNRLDTKQSGFFLSVIGGLSFIYILFNFRNEKLRKARLFNYAFLLHFAIYAAFINVINIGNLEPGYRIILPYTVVVLAVSVCAVFDSFDSKKIKIALLAVFILFLAHSLYYARTNMANIHSEEIISEGTLRSESEFVKTLPLDGRLITYGLFANAVDAGMASATNHYFTRYQYNLWSEINNIHEKVHTENSFGDFPELDKITGLELRNYYILGGYKYLLLNICHPIGNKVLQKVYPNYTMPMYQNTENKCLAILQVNNATYSDKVSVVKNIDNNVYKTPDGYKYITISNLNRYGFNPSEILKNAPSSPATNPMELSFKRINPHEAVIDGSFKDNEWVVFKEEYFPRWKAYMNNAEVPVYPTNFNMILIKTINGNSITLKYDMMSIEKIFSFISLIAVILCSIVFILLLKYEI